MLGGSCFEIVLSVPVWKDYFNVEFLIDGLPASVLLLSVLNMQETEFILHSLDLSQPDV